MSHLPGINSANGTASVRFGKEMRKKHFLFEDKLVPLNQGSFGSYPNPVRDALRALQDEAEANPDKFIRYTYPERLNGVRAMLAKLLHAHEDELVIVPNATIAVNTVLRNANFRDGDKIIYLGPIYGAVLKTLQYLVESTPVQTIEVDFTLPIADDELAERFRAALKEHGASVKYAVFDTIASIPGVKMPYQLLTEICREHGVLSLIDAAHGVGHIPLDLDSLQPDFLFTNCHKWLYAPRASAILYVPFRHQSMIRSTLPTSHGFQPLTTDGKKIFSPLPPAKSSNAFVSQFEFVGTIDTAPPLCVSAALEFRDSICGGEDNIRAYRFDLAEKAEAKVAEILGAKPLAVPKASRVAFANVWLPLRVAAPGEPHSEHLILEEDIPLVSGFLSQKMIDEYNCFLPILFYKGSWIARFSAEIYLDIDDFIHGAEMIKILIERVKNREYKA